VTIGYIHIRQVSGKNEIIGFDCGTEKQRASIPQRQPQFREKPGSLEENPLLAHPERLDVAIAVKYGKHFAVFQDSCPIVRGGRRRRYVVLLGDTSFVQLRSPVVGSTAWRPPLTMRS
jgi:hypothetical protein